MANEVGVRTLTQSAGVASETASLTGKVNQVRVTNYHATAQAWVKVHTSDVSAAAALAAAAAGPAVVGADECFIVPAGQTKVIFKSPKRQLFVALATIASGAATTIVVEGTTWTDGT